MIKNDELNAYIVSREELKDMSVNDFEEGDTIICNKYYIHVEYGGFSRASLLTRVSTRNSLLDLPISRQPRYIKDFIAR